MKPTLYLKKLIPDNKYDFLFSYKKGNIKKNIINKLC